MTGLSTTLTFTFDDMAQAERAIAAVREVLSPAPSDADEANQGGDHAKSDHRSHRHVLTDRRRHQGDTPMEPRELARVTGDHNNEGHVARPASESATSSGPDVKRAPHSEMDGAIAAVKGQARPASVVDAEPSPSSTLNPFIAIRPNCQKPDHCSGYGRNHCHACKVKAAAEAEAA